MSEEKGIDRLVEKYHCKISVIRLDFNEDLYKEYPYGHASQCGRLSVGQEFISTSRWELPNGLCAWAWRDLLPMIQSYHEGRNHPSVSCCTDGLRPVTFKLEKVEAL